MDWREFIVFMTSAIVALIFGLPSLRKAFMGDKIAVQAGVNTPSRAGTAQAFAQLNEMLAQKREDDLGHQLEKTELRNELRRCQTHVESFISARDRRIEILTQERNSARLEVARLSQKRDEGTV